MKRQFAITLILLGLLATPVWAQSVGNPRPGFPHDTVIFHVMKGENGPKQCDGGHSLFLRHFGGEIPDTLIYITMLDWVQLDNDGDLAFDEDPDDDVDNDLDGATDEDGPEPGKSTSALDCDAWGDGELRLQIRDADPRPGIVSTQEWFMRLIGKPEQNFAFTSFANQTVSCTLVDPDAGVTGDEFVECVSGEEADWVELASFNLADLGCAKQVKLGGKNGVSAGGKTPFCDVTEGFEVDVDTENDGITDLFDQFVFSISCVDNPLTTDINETEHCPLSSIIWDVDEEETTSQAKAQVFVGHTGSASIKSGKIVRR